MTENHSYPEPIPSAGPWMTMSDISRELGVSKTTASKLLKSGTIKAYKVEGSWRVTVPDFMEYLNSTYNRNQNRENSA